LLSGVICADAGMASPQHTPNIAIRDPIVNLKLKARLNVNIGWNRTGIIAMTDKPIWVNFC
jgi:hypothetical protein